ncbi:exported hypothetical protein [uncultured Desulfobacterium sp.]|uniref:Uncharacterized protein n=1 Tax=uncultured Desulfobacterium sp. TaxID=201089 RepID=A0A445MZQ1_9BACT|nr:exported hypothetical protein [uncultured Desulfobacterium sp.]
MKNIFLCLTLAILLPLLCEAQEDAFRYLEPIEKKYAGLKDYTADVKIHFDMETFKAPDMEAKIYYKFPDKVKVESKRVIFFPKEGGHFNPALFKEKDYEIKLLKALSDAGKNTVRLRLTPKTMKRNLKRLILTIDTDRNIIPEMEVIQFDGRKMKASIEYMTSNGFDLPSHIKLNIDIPSYDTEGVSEFDQWFKKPKGVNGSIEMTYSNYVINSGYRFDFFKRSRPSRKR